MNKDKGKGKDKGDVLPKEGSTDDTAGTFVNAGRKRKPVLRVVKKQRVKLCKKCLRNTQAPLFDGCMIAGCPHGYKPCL